MRMNWEINWPGSGSTTDTRTECTDPRFGNCRTLGARLRNSEREHNEFATRTYLHPGAAADPGRRVMGSSDLAVQDSQRDGHGDGSRVVPGDLGRDDDRDDVSCGSPDDPGFRTGPA